MAPNKSSRTKNLLPPYFLKQLILTNRLKMRFFKMEKCNFLKKIPLNDLNINVFGNGKQKQK